MNNILLYSEFKEFPLEEQKALIERWREKYPNKIIYKNMDMNHVNYYALLHNLGVKLQERKKRVKVIPEIQTETVQNGTKAPVEVQMVEGEEMTAKTPTEPISEYKQCNGFSTQLKGTFHANELADKLRRLADFIENDGNYEVHIQITEK